MRLLVVLSILLVAACAAAVSPDLDTLYGKADPKRFDAPTPPPAGMSYARDVQPILDRRCVVCHACYDAPCQLKATNWDGLARGGSKVPVYDSSRIVPAPTTRLEVDADRASAWRTMGFHAVFDERDRTDASNRANDLVRRMLALKAAHPAVDADGPDLGAVPAQMCPANADEMTRYEQATPTAGMPWNLPALTPKEQETLTRWLALGAPAEAPAPVAADAQRQVADWERFLNADDAKTRLFARYAYEHLFLAHLYFEGETPYRYFKLIRSSTPPGEPVRIIATRRPVDDPGVKRVWYRLVPERETIVAKTHMPYALSAARMARWKSLFLDPRYEVKTLPGYDAETASNPFATFRDLPVGARYRFMLEEAQYTIMGFIKGPVCRGQMALDVIDDHFWVTFLAPTESYDAALSEALAKERNLARLPNGSSAGTLIQWPAYAHEENRYLADRSRHLDAYLRGHPLDLDLLWNGDGRNDNAALTVFRHFDSATVTKGLIGGAPKTAWVIGYPLLERIHYLLVADFDVFGSFAHQLDTRLYMDYLRMEGEFNFLVLLPAAQRTAVRDSWYVGDGERVRRQVYGGPATTIRTDSAVRYASGDPKSELLGMLKQRFAPLRAGRPDSVDDLPEPWRTPLRSLAATQGSALQWMPEAALLVVASPDGSSRTVSVVRNTAHRTVSHVMGEKKELVPANDTLTVVPGVLPAYPNAFYRARVDELPALTRDVAQLGSRADYSAFVKRWGVRRDDPTFWANSDAVHARYAREQPLEAGVLDYNRLETR